MKDRISAEEYIKKYINHDRRKHDQPEYREQCKVARYLAEQWPDLLWTASAGGMRTTAGTGAKMKAAGYRAGCPDIMIFHIKGSIWIEKEMGKNSITHHEVKYYGLHIEMKSEAGTQSPAQKEWQKKAEAAGYNYSVCHSYEEAVGVIEAYLEIEKVGV